MLLSFRREFIMKVGELFYFKKGSQFLSDDYLDYIGTVVRITEINPEHEEFEYEVETVDNITFSVNSDELVKIHHLHLLEKTFTIGDCERIEIHSPLFNESGFGDTRDEALRHLLMKINGKALMFTELTEKILEELNE